MLNSYGTTILLILFYGLALIVGIGLLVLMIVVLLNANKLLKLKIAKEESAKYTPLEQSQSNEVPPLQ